MPRVFLTEHIGARGGMRTSGSILLVSTVCFATLISSGCKGKSNSSAGLQGPPAGTAPGTNPNETGGTVIPPTPVLGSYLVAEIRRDDGTPIANAKVGLLGTQTTATPTPTPTGLNFWLDSSTAQVIYETESNAAGQVSLPVSKISSDQLDLKIQDAGRVLNSQVKLPSDIAQAVSQKRVDGGLTSLPNYPAVPSNPQGATAPIADIPIERKLALQLPENRVVESAASDPNQVTVEQVYITPASLPNTTEPAAKAVDIFPMVENLSTGSAVRFGWQNPFTEPADVRIAFSFTESTVSGWNGKIESFPDLTSSRSGINLITNYSDCSDSSFRTSGSGTMTSLNDGKCGFMRNQFPFNDGGDVYVRIAGESATSIKLSPVFRITFSNTAPTMAAISNQTVMVNTAKVEIPLTLADAETPLVCGAALSARSDNEFLLPNQNIFVVGTFPNCKLSLYPKSATSGLSNVTVVVSDGSLTAIRSFSFEVNSNPTNVLLSGIEVNENEPVGTVVGLLSTADLDIGDTFTYTLSGGDAAAFTIAGNALKTSASVNFETKSSYSIVVTTTDQDGLSFAKSFTISVKNLNEAPTDILLSNNTISENIPLGSPVGFLAAVDPDAGNTFTYTLSGADAAAFSVSAGMLVTNSAVDFDTKSSYMLTITARDQNNLQFSKPLVISVTNVNEPPNDISLSATTVSENVLAGTIVGLLDATDPDGGNTFNYTLGGTDAAAFAIMAGNLVTNSEIDFETKPVYSITISARDQDLLQFTKAFTITVLNVNENPTNIILSKTTINEGLAIGTTVANLSTSDVDVGNTHTYVVTGTDAASFTITGSQLKNAVVFNYEAKTSYSITLRSTDQSGLFITKNVTITVNNVNESSTDILLSANTIGENLPAGTTIGTLSTVDPDVGSVFSYTLGGIDAASFSIVGNTLRSAEVFQYSVKTQYQVTITSTDTDGLFVSKVFFINIGPPAMAPTDILLSRNTVWENAGPNGVVGTLSAVDSDTPSSNIIFSLVAGTGDTDNLQFNISGNLLRATSSLDFELQDLFSVRVRASDPEGTGFEKSFVIRAVDVFEDPQFDKVTFLAHFDESHGSDPTIDNSSSPRTLVKSGAPTITAGRKKFGIGSYRLKTTTNSKITAGSINIPSGTDFTMEGWWYRITGGNPSVGFTLFSIESTTGGDSFRFDGNYDTQVCIFNIFRTNAAGSSLLTPACISSSSQPMKVWNHFAITRVGDVIKIYLNGNEFRSLTFNYSMSGNLVVAQQYSPGEDYGYLDDVRITVGLARYTANFTPATTPFPDGLPPTQIPNIPGALYTQTSMYTGSSAVSGSLLTDGSIKTGVSATNSEPGSGAIKLDLGRRYQIDRIMVGTSHPAAAAPLNDKSLTEDKIVEYSMDNSNWLVAFNTGTLPGLGIYKFDVDIHARYLRIRNNSSGSGILAVSEFFALSPGQSFLSESTNPEEFLPMAWYDAGDASTILLDSPTSATPKVSSWMDKSFRARNLSQAVGSNRPSIARDNANGRNSLTWPTTDNNLFLESASTITVGEIYAVGRFNGPVANSFSNYEAIVGPRSNTALPWLTSIYNSVSFNASVFLSMFLNGVSTTNRIDNVFPEMSSTTLARAIIDGTSVTSTSGITVGIDRLNITQGRGWKGQISELLLYSPPLSSTDRTTVENYLKSKWGISP